MCYLLEQMSAIFCHVRLYSDVKGNPHLSVSPQCCLVW